MTVTGDPARPPASSDGVAEHLDPEAGAGALDVICPYLTAGDGTWQSAHPIRSQRCGAVDPPAILARDKQRDLCLLSAHRGCATYLAARAGAPSPDPVLAKTTRTCGRTRGRRCWSLETERRLPGLSGSPVRAGGQARARRADGRGVRRARYRADVPDGVRRIAGRIARSRRVAVGHRDAVRAAIAIVERSPSAEPTPKPSASPKATPRPTAKPGTGATRSRVATPWAASRSASAPRSRCSSGSTGSPTPA